MRGACSVCKWWNYRAGTCDAGYACQRSVGSRKPVASAEAPILSHELQSLSNSELARHVYSAANLLDGSTNPHSADYAREAARRLREIDEIRQAVVLYKTALKEAIEIHEIEYADETKIGWPTRGMTVEAPYLATVLKMWEEKNG